MTQVLSTPPTFKPGETPEEIIKQKKDGLDCIEDIHRFAQEGFDKITEDDFTRFKWYGVYRQKPKDSGYFMLRVKVPGGTYDTRQLKVMASLADEYGHGFADITTRQAFQMHWLRIEQFPEIFRRFEEVGMDCRGACGDLPRNIVGCPLAGIDANEILDATPYLEQIDAHLSNNREFSNLPRKYKISVSGCRIHCTQPDIHCLGLFGLERKVNGRAEAGFGVKVGGGLSSSPHIAQTLPVFVKPEQVLAMAHYVSVVYRDNGYRDRRAKARFKFLVADWGAERILAEVERLSGIHFDRHDEFIYPDDPETDHIGIGKQKQEGLYYVGVCFAGGRVSARELAQIADIAGRYCKPGLDRIRNTNKQNLVILNVPEDHLDAMKTELKAAGLNCEPSNFRKGCVSCTGIEFCNLAVTETKNRMIKLMGQLEQEASFFKDKIRIHFSGCPSSCGQHQVADIGFRGAQRTVDGVKHQCFDMFLGGKLGEGAHFNKLVLPKVDYDDVHKTIGKLLKYFQDNRNEGEAFHAFVDRVDKAQIKAFLKDEE